MKRAIALLLVLVLLTTTVAMTVGCSRNDDQERLVIWSFMNQGEPIGLWHQQVTDRFMELYPDVDVELVFAGREVLTQFAAQLQDRDSRDFPDLISQGTGAMNPLAAEGLFMPLDEFFATEMNLVGNEVWGQTFVPGLMETIKFEGRSYYVPEGLYITGIFYDEVMFERFGLEVPTTWDELMEISEILLANGIAPFALDGAVDQYNAWWWIRFADRLVGTERLNQAAAGEISFRDHPGFLEAARYVYTIQDRGFFQSGFAGSIFPAAQVLWVQGRAAMFFCGAWIPSEMAEQTPPEMRMQMFPIPEIPNSYSPWSEEVWSNVFAVTTDGRNTEHAINWLRIKSSEEFQDKKVDLKNPTVLVTGNTVPELRETVNIVNNATSTSGIYADLQMHGAWMMTILNPLATDLILGRITPEVFIDRLATDTELFHN